MDFYQKIETLKKNFTGQVKPSGWFVRVLGCNIATLLKHGFIAKEGNKGYYRIQIPLDFDNQAFAEKQKQRQAQAKIPKNNHPWRKTDPEWKRRADQKQNPFMSKKQAEELLRQNGNSFSMREIQSLGLRHRTLVRNKFVKKNPGHKTGFKIIMPADFDYDKWVIEKAKSGSGAARHGSINSHQQDGLVLSKKYKDRLK